MKLTNLSLTNKIKTSKTDFMSHMKYYLGIVIALLVSAIFVVSFLGFKADFDYAGGTVLTVISNGVNDDKQYNDTVNRIDKILKENNVEVSSYQYENNPLGHAVVVKTLNKDENVNTAIISAINAEFEYNAEDLLQGNYVKASVVNPTAVNATKMAAVALAVIIIVLALAAVFRYNLAIALNFLISTVLDILITISMVIICRIQINVSITAAIILVFAISSITKLLFFKRVSQNFKDENYKDLTGKQHAILADKEIFSTLVLITVISVVALILLAGLGTLQVRGFAIPALIGTIFSALTTFYFTPYLWDKMKEIKIRKIIKK